MSGDPKGSKKDIFFEVYWTGYDVPTWKPWSSMRKVSALHTYLSNHTDSKVRALNPIEPTEVANDNDSDTD
jgi:hypothetical protein